MCIENRLTRDQRRVSLKNKPRIIKVWKVIKQNGKGAYGYESTSVNILRPVIHEAQNKPDNKVKIDYAPGFHCYLTKASAAKHTREWARRVEPFYIRKEWVTQIGTAFYSNHTVYVSKKLTPDRSLLK